MQYSNNEVSNPSVLGGNIQTCGRLDLDTNNKLDIIDLANLSSKMDEACEQPTFTWGCGNLDFNEDEVVNSLDLNNLLAKYQDINGCRLGSEFYASTLGSLSGDGSINNPWDLQTALNSDSIIPPGSTLWLRGGTYVSSNGVFIPYGPSGYFVFESKLKGINGSPIVISGYPGEKAKIDGSIIFNNPTSAWNWLWNVEITNSSLDRNITDISVPRYTGVNSFSRGFKIINSYINNTGHPAIGEWSQIEDGGEAYGVTAWGNGVYDFNPGWNGSPRGAAIYTQNVIGSRYVENNIFFSNLTTGLSVHGEAGFVNGFKLSRNTVFNHPQADSILYSSNNTGVDYLLDSNTFYSFKGGFQSIVNIGHFGGNENGIVRDNVFYNRVVFRRLWQDLVFENNTIISDRELLNIEDPLNIVFSGNDYYKGGGTLLTRQSINYRKFNELVSNTLDNQSTYSRYKPVQNLVFVRPNKYEFGKANVTIYNWELKQTIEIDASSFLGFGDHYIIRDPMNYSTPIASRVYSGNTIGLPTHLYEYEKLIGIPNYNHKNTAPEFLNFIIERVDADTLLQVEPPIISPLIQVFATPTQQISLSTNTPDAQIYYTLDGTNPTQLSALYSSPITISASTIIKTFAYKANMALSVKLQFEINKVDIESGLAGKYSFEENDLSTTIVNTALNGTIPTGNIVGSIPRVTGLVGKAIQLPGEANPSYISLGNGNNSINKYSVAFLAKIDPTQNIGTLIGNGSSQWSLVNYFIGYDLTTNRITNNMWTTNNGIIGVNSTNCQDLTEWNHYVFTFDEISARLYCNGSFMSETLHSASQAGSGSLLAIGRSGSFNSSYAKGLLDELRIYHNKSLSEVEVGELFKLYKDVL